MIMKCQLVATFLVLAFCAITSIEAGSFLLQKRSTEKTCVDQFTTALTDCGTAHGINPNEPDPPTWAASEQSCCTMVNCLAGKAPGNDNTCKDNFATNFERVKGSYKAKAGCQTFKCFSTGGALVSFPSSAVNIAALSAALLVLFAFF